VLNTLCYAVAGHLSLKVLIDFAFLVAVALRYVKHR
jgi:hypothetical protein